jgi:hypothetical protein
VSDCLFCKIAAKAVPAALVLLGGRPMYWPPD